MISKSALKEEAIRRMRTMHISELIISDFVKDNQVGCIEAEGGVKPLVDEDMKTIADYESNGGLVYLVTKGICDGVDMTNYLVVSPYEDDWEIEFALNRKNLYEVAAIVQSPLTHGIPDFGTIILLALDGRVRRMPYDDAIMCISN